MLTAAATVREKIEPILFDWPRVEAFAGFDGRLAAFLALGPEEQAEHVRVAAAIDPDGARAFVHDSLGSLYPYFYGYKDSPCHARLDDELEIRIHGARIVLERAALNDAALAFPDGGWGTAEAVSELASLVADNPGIEHPLFRYVGRSSTPESMWVFLMHEVLRNEIVDDEISMLPAGLHRGMKSVTSENMWDEVGRGRLAMFHTRWLELLLSVGDRAARIREYRSAGTPWFTKISSNYFNLLLTRPSLRHAAYGWFAITESWVPPHFKHVLEGLGRHGWDDGKTSIYFSSHLVIDAKHGSDLVQAFAQEAPTLTSAQRALVVWGARLAVETGMRQSDAMLAYMKSIDGKEI